MLILSKDVSHPATPLLATLVANGDTEATLPILNQVPLHCSLMLSAIQLPSL
jgi:hypothetical protein